MCITKNYPVTVNDPQLTEAMSSTLRRVAGDGHWRLIDKVSGSEDFSFFQKVLPGMFIFLGVTPEGIEPAKSPSNHSPRFFIDERALVTGVRVLAHLTCDRLEARPSEPAEALAGIRRHGQSAASEYART